MGAELVYVGARVSGLVLVAPVFSARSVPMRLRAVIIILLTVVLLPAAGTLGAQADVARLLAESLVGFAIGFAAAVFIGAVESAGDYLSMQIGLSGAALFDPMSGQQTAVLGQLMRLFALTMLLVADGHLIMIDALAASFDLVPIGSLIDAGAGLGAMVGLGSMLFTIGFRFAAPVVIAVLLGNVALAVLSRAAPQVNMIGVAFPMQIALGLFALAASLPMSGMLFADWAGSYDAVVGRLLAIFAGRGG
jgi:flagellar biosynthesis protein FliR